MSGELPVWNQHLYSKGGWRKSAHLKDNYNGVDLVGGFYDAGGTIYTHLQPFNTCTAPACTLSRMQHAAAMPA
jgi:hypothetical protein